MKEQHINTYNVDSYTSFSDMRSDMANHIKRGWFIKAIHKAYSDFTIVVYEREVANQTDENIS